MPNKPEEIGFSTQESGDGGTSEQLITQGVSPPMVRSPMGDQNDIVKYTMPSPGESCSPLNKLTKSAMACSIHDHPLQDEERIEKQRLREEELHQKIVQPDSRLHHDRYSSSSISSMTSENILPTDSGSDISLLRSSSSSSTSSGAQPTSMPHGYNVEIPFIPPEDYPAEFKEQQYDCVLIYSGSEVDARIAVNFKDIVQNNIRLEDGRPPQICILDRGDNLPHIQSRFKHSDIAMQVSTYMFLVLTEDFVKDSWAEMQKDECLMASIDEPDRKWCVVPLHTQKKKDQTFRYPYGLRALKGVDITAMLRNKYELANVDPGRVSAADIDPYFIQNITKMFNMRLDAKRKREREQQSELNLWIQKEQLRRMKKRVEEQQKKREIEAKHRRDMEILRESHEQQLDRIAMDKEVNDSGDQASKATENMSDQEKLIALQKIGVPLDEAIKMILGQKLASTGAANTGGVIYNIYNSLSGTVQVGSGNTQYNQATSAQSLDADVDDTEYHLVEVEGLMQDNPAPSSHEAASGLDNLRSQTTTNDESCNSSRCLNLTSHESNY